MRPIRSQGPSPACTHAYYGKKFLCPELNQFWDISGSGYVVVDCAGDSILADSYQPFGTGPAWFEPSIRRVYAGGGKTYVFDMDSGLVVDSIASGGSVISLYCAPQAHKLYEFESVWKAPDTVVVVDTRNNSIVSRFAIPASFGPLVVLGDRTGDYVYVGGYADTVYMGWKLFVIDIRTDSIVSKMNFSCFTQIVRDAETNRLYCNISPSDSIIQVLRDSVVLAGLCAKPGDVTRAWNLQTLVNSSTPLRIPEDAFLYDATGRKVAVLPSGPNDISRLTPGVYFVCGKPQPPSRKLQAVRKVVVTR